MPTIITHGVVGLALGAKARGLRASDRRRLLVACVACAALPDIDSVGYALGVQYSSLFGHRGFTHSLLFAALVALAASWLLHRRVRETLPGFGRLFLLFFAVTASHGLLDAMTDGGEGIAFFSPVSNHRYFFPYRPIMVSPLGLGAFFGSLRGLLVLVDEVLLVIFPLGLVLFLPELWRRAKAYRLFSLAVCVSWALSLAVLNGLSPLNNISMTLGTGGHPVIDLYAKQYRNPDVLFVIPTFGVPGNKLVTNFLELQHRGLFNRRIEADNAAGRWASGFFPS